MSDDFDISKLLNMVLSGLGVIALVYIIVKLFRLDRFIPPEIPFFSESQTKPSHIQQPIVLQEQSRPQSEQVQPAVIESPQAYGDYYYTDLYQNIPNVPQLPEPSVTHNKAGNKTQVEDLPFVRSDYNTGDVADPKEPFFDESTVVTGLRPIVVSKGHDVRHAPEIRQPIKRNTKNSESWSIQRDSEGNLIGISVDRDVKEYE